MSNREVFEELRGKVFPVLDDGHVVLLDVMGDDMAVVDAARISYGRKATGSAKDRELIRYMMRHGHGTPFEMCEVKLRVRLPMDVARQWVRHRTASLNEYSTRYSEAIDAAQSTGPDAWRLQSTDNKQGSGGFLSGWTGEGGRPNPGNDSPEWALDHAARISGKIPEGEPISPGRALSIIEADFHRVARDVYEQRIAMGVAREQARKDLPLSTYTEWIWKMDLRNLLQGFLAQRMDSHAQAEIRAFANVVGPEIVAELFPITWEAFEDYVLCAVTLTRLDVVAVDAVSSGLSADDAMLHIHNKRERDECRAKLVALGLISA